MTRKHRSQWLYIIGWALIITALILVIVGALL